MTRLLNYAVHGTPAQRTLLLIHPLGADLTFWDDCIAIWQPHARCVACDLRSAGRSPRASAPVTVGEHVSDLVDLLDHLSAGPVVAVACAVGTMIASALAARHPERVSALVLSNPTARTKPAAKEMLADRAAVVRRSGMAGILPAAVERAFLDQPRDARYQAYFDRFASQDADAYALSVLGFAEADVTEDLPKVACPTLLVAGGHDVLLPPEQAREVNALVPHARFELIEDGAHFLPFQRPERFATLVLDFLAGIA